MDFSKNSSFAPLEYYKRLTKCLANRKNLKVNLAAIPGVQNIRNRRNKVELLTDKKINERVIAKYSRQQQENSEPQQASQSTGVNFKLVSNNNKDGVILEKPKRKKPDYSYLNLSPNFFKSYKGPDISLFKIPNPPPPKKMKIDADRNAGNRSTSTTNFTIASLFSGDFKPPQASTPLEHQEQVKEKKQRNIDDDQQSFFAMLREDGALLRAPKEPTAARVEELQNIVIEPPKTRATEVSRPRPFISDPSPILKEINASKSYQSEIAKQRESERRRQFADLATRAATKWDNKSFKRCPNPIRSLQYKLRSLNNIATQSPRPSLLSSGGPKTPIVAAPKPPFKIPGLPVPIFYDEQKKTNQKGESFRGLMSEAADSLRSCNIQENLDYLKTPISLLSIVREPTSHFVDQNDLESTCRPTIMNDTRALFSDAGGKQEGDLFNFSGFQFKLFDTPAIDTPMVSEFGTHRDPALEALFGSPTQYTRKEKEREMSWLEQPFDASINYDEQPPPLPSRSSFATFRSPPKHIRSDENLEKRFANAINRQSQQQQMNTSVDFFACNDNNDDGDEDLWWMRNFNDNSSLMIDNQDFLFDTSFF